MANFQVVLEGKGAVAAAKELQELLAEIGVSGTMEVPNQEKRRAGFIEGVILNFVMAVSANVVADQITDYIRKNNSSRPEKQIERVVLINSNKHDSNRLLINFPFSSEEDKAEEILKLLEEEDF